MGNGIVERLGTLFIIVLGVVIVVIVGWGFGAPPPEPGADPGPIQPLVAREGNDPVTPDPVRPPPWPPDDRRNDSAGGRGAEGTAAGPVGGGRGDQASQTDVLPPPPPPPPPSPDLEHVVAKGDTLYSIARKYYGDAKHWKVVAQANPGVDPRDLKIGTTLKIPDPDVVLSRDAPDRAAPPAAPGPDVYVVQPGDNLWKIAAKTLGSRDLHKKILDANADVLTGNGDDLRVGMKLKIPR